mgnify:CR=1 FL=1
MKKAAYQYSRATVSKTGKLDVNKIHFILDREQNREKGKSERISQQNSEQSQLINQRKNDLPPIKLHCSVLAEDAIKAAIKDYQDKNKHDKENVA